jgi:hypothetical protein
MTKASATADLFCDIYRIIFKVMCEKGKKANKKSFSSLIMQKAKEHENIFVRLYSW